MTYLRNTWYVAAWASELGADQLLARRLLDEPVVMFRDGQGTAHALLDRCPHRFVPLSAGHVTASGHVQCGYHGLAFDGSGQCVDNPHGDHAIPKAARTRSYPLVERHGVLWIWMGDAQQADATTIPDFSCMNRDAWYVGEGYLKPAAHYQLEIDNILDLSHIEFLHSSLLGSEAVRRAKTEVRQEGRSVWSLRFMQNEQLPAAACEQFGVPVGMAVDRWLDVRWDAPANMLLLGGACPTGRPRAEQVGLPFTNPHLFTPETQSSSHYWFAMCLPHSMGPGAQALAQQITDVFKDTFDREDTPMLVLQQSSIGAQDFWGLKPVLLPSDAGGVRVRRQLDQLIAAEQAALASAPR